MRIYDVINKKKNGEELTEAEIREFVRAYTASEIPDYQASALLMAICLRGMTERETYVLTDAISTSGDVIDLSSFGDKTADKHSTGGVGDKTTLIVAPLAASLGCVIAKMSGRGLGHTGGTVDKLESIPGYKTALTSDEFFSLIKRTGIAVAGQSGNLAPADKKLYALRDVTATVDSVPLIASSVMGKKIAAGASVIVLDVKYGSGSFMKTTEEAELLASAMVKLGRLAKRRVRAIISNMDVPLGSAIGNAIEVWEAIETLKGNGPLDLTELSLELASEMASLALGIDKSEAKLRARLAIENGTAFDKFKEWISGQGGDASVLESKEFFTKAAHSHDVLADEDGYISMMNAEKIGICALELGAGRRSKDDEIDHTAGIILKKKTGELVKKGDVLAILHTSREETIPAARELFLESISFSGEKPKKSPLIHKTV